MLEVLNNPTWATVFAHPDVVATGITREDVIAFVGNMVAPDHETQPGCELFCSNGYLAIFILKSNKVLLIQAYCDPSRVVLEHSIATIGESIPQIVSELPGEDRISLCLHTTEDTNYDSHYDLEGFEEEDAQQ